MAIIFFVRNYYPVFTGFFTLIFISLAKPKQHTSIVKTDCSDDDNQPALRVFVELVIRAYKNKQKKEQSKDT
jgi:hypothetical protein